MIGADDLADFFDPDEFGCTAQLIEPGKAPVAVVGMFGKPEKSGGLYRGGIDPGAAQIRGKGIQEHLQLATSQVPAAWKTAKVVSGGIEYSITAVEPLGRVRSVLTLIPYGDRAVAPAERGKWQASN